MKFKSFPINPPRPGPGQFSFDQFLEWAAANSRSPVPLPRFARHIRPHADVAAKYMLPQNSDTPLAPTSELIEIVQRTEM